MGEEFALHLALRTEDLIRAGLSPAEAARRARLEFGSTERYKQEGRTSRGLRRVDVLHVSWLDFKLGLRMLVRYPGLTLVGGLAFAFAIWVGAGAFEIVRQMISPRLPLPEGHRIVGIELWNASSSFVERRALHELVTWQTELRSVEDLGAFRTLQRNLITTEGGAEPVELAEISASAFRVTGVAPLLGRTLVTEDERPDAPPVVVVGHELWQRRFLGDPTIIGRAVRIGGTDATVVGVMPAGYTFPIAEHLWVPLRIHAQPVAPGEGPPVRIFGRLTSGRSIDDANAELAALGRRAAVDFPETHAHLRPQVMPYARSILNLSGAEALLIGSTNVFLGMFLVLVCGNVALLLFARAATRETELVVRSALGASRGRIVMQLFAEALVLGTAAALVGVMATNFGLRWAMSIVERELLASGARLPFWFDARVSLTTVLYVGALTLLGAAIAGVLPALKVTRGLQHRLRAAGAGGGGVRVGGIWTAVIVAQVAVTIVFPLTAFITRRDAAQIREIEADFPAERFLSARVDLDREHPGSGAADTSQAAIAERFGASVDELERRLEAEPDVVGVTFAERLPRMYHPHRLVEMDAGGAAPLNPNWPAYRVSSASVELDYFEVLGVPVLAGRRLHSGDLAAARASGDGASDPPGEPVIVNQAFVDLVLGGRNPIDRRVRYVHREEWRRQGEHEPGPWHQIVGIVPNLGMSGADDPKIAGIYHPMARGATAPVHLAVRVRGDPASFTPRLRALAMEVDPALRLERLLPMHELSDAELEFIGFWFRIILLVSGLAVLLSLAGIYSVMSFTVSRRTREIGVRVALGGRPRRVIGAVLRRPLTQVGAGVAAGALLGALLLGAAVEGVEVTLGSAAAFTGYIVAMLAICLLACVVPARRALRVEPTEALRAEA